MPRQNNIQIRRGTAAEWSSSNPVLDDGEIGYDKTNNNIKIGDGTKTWSSLSYTTGETGPASEALKLNSLTFNGSTTTFALASGATTVYPASAAALIISLNGVVQEPVTDYTVSGSNITFSQAPAADAAFFGVSLNGIAAPITAASITSGTLDIARIPTGTSSSTVCIGNDARLSDTRTPTDNTVSTAKLQDDAVTYAKIQNVSATDRLLGRSSAGAGDVEEVTCSAFGRSLIDDADAASARTTLGLAIGTNVQAYDAELAALAGVTSAADALPYFTGSGTATTTTLTSFGRSLIDDADAASARTTLGLAIGTNVQAYDAELAALAGVTSAADALPYFTGAGTATTTTLTSFGRSLIDDADAAAARTTLSVQPTASPAFTGAATFANTGNVVPLTVTNAGTANSFVVNDQSGDPTPFVIDASGNVGIKATSTASSLNVVGNSAFYQDANGTPSLGSKSFYAATFENFSAGYGLAIGGVSGATGACIVQVQSFSISAAYDLLLQPLGGNVGIGTTTPGGRLEVAGGQLLVTAGSGSSGSYKPGVAVSGDDDTGIQQVGGANTISLVTAGSERLRISSTGAVGISTDPVSGFPLAVFSFATSDANKATLLLNGTVGSGQSFAGVRFTHNVFSTGWAADILCVDTGNFGGILSFRTSAAGSATATPTERMRVGSNGRVQFFANSEKFGVQLNNGSTGNGPFIGSDGADIFTISTSGGAERVRVDASGNVGIGAAPSDKFHVEQSSGIATIILKSAASVAARINFQTTTDGNGYINYDTGAWKFFTNNAGAATERVQIASDGKLYAFNTYGTTVGATNRDLFIDSGGLIGYVSSIRASKTNIAAIDDVSWLRDLTPVSFHYRRKNEDGTYSDEPDGTLDYGLIAEDVEPVAPELCFYDVVDGEPQLRGVHYSKLITPMLRYIQQLEQRIAALEERLN